jgi:hypothetical protein
MGTKRDSVEFVALAAPTAQRPVEGPAWAGGLMRRWPSECRGDLAEADLTVPPHNDGLGSCATVHVGFQVGDGPAARCAACELLDI